MYYTVGVLLWLSHPAALNLASAQISKHYATAGRQHLHTLIKLQIITKQRQNPMYRVLLACIPSIHIFLIRPYSVIMLVLK